MEQETLYRRLTQEQLDTFTLDMNSAYARLKGIEEAIDSTSEFTSALPGITFRRSHSLYRFSMFLSLKYFISD